MILLLGSALCALSRHRFAAIAIGAGAFVLAACQGPDIGGSATNPSSLGSLAQDALAPAQSPPYTFVAFNVGTGNNTYLTGINDDKSAPKPNIVGVYYSALSIAPKYKSFTTFYSDVLKGDGAYSPYPPNAPPNSDIYLAGVSDTGATTSSGDKNKLAVGFAPPFAVSVSGGTPCSGMVCGVIYDPRNILNYHLYQIRDPNEGSGACANTYLYGTNGSTIQVGYYTDSDGYPLK